MQISSVTLSWLAVNLWKIISELYKKIGKMSIKDWGTVEKIGWKLETVLVLSNICWNFEKKLLEYSENRRGNFENLWENL